MLLLSFLNVTVVLHLGDDWISEFARKQELEAKAKKLKVLLFSVPVTEHFFNLSTGCYFPVHLFLAKSIH